MRSQFVNDFLVKKTNKQSNINKGAMFRVFGSYSPSLTEHKLLTQ